MSQVYSVLQLWLNDECEPSPISLTEEKQAEGHYASHSCEACPSSKSFAKKLFVFLLFSLSLSPVPNLFINHLLFSPQLLDILILPYDLLASGYASSSEKNPGDLALCKLCCVAHCKMNLGCWPLGPHTLSKTMTFRKILSYISSLAATS